MKKSLFEVVMMKKMFVLSFILLSVFLVSCSSSEKACSVDNDCVTATCCHASDSVNKDAGPNCAGQICTQECVPDTIDCGQGEIKCVSGSCEVVLNE